MFWYLGVRGLDPAEREIVGKGNLRSYEGRGVGLPAQNYIAQDVASFHSDSVYLPHDALHHCSWSTSTYLNIAQTWQLIIVTNYQEDNRT